MDRRTGFRPPLRAALGAAGRPGGERPRHSLRVGLRDDNLLARGLRRARSQERGDCQRRGDLSVRRPFYEVLLLPLSARLFVFYGTANAVVRLFGVPAASEAEESHSEEELRIIIEHSARRGVLDADEKDMLEAVFELEERRAREVMVPRPDVVSLPAGMPLSVLFPATAKGKPTRYPVHHDDSTDRIVGALHIGDVIRAVEDQGLQAQLTARDLVREVLIVPENRAIDEVLKDLQRQKMEMAIVIDEWGSFEGVLTVEDILEEIVGEIRDEFDEEEPTLQKLPNGSYSVDGHASLTEVNRALGSEFESEDFETIGGLIFGLLGRTPEVGDEVALDGYALRVEEVDGPRVARLIVREREEDAAVE